MIQDKARYVVCPVCGEFISLKLIDKYGSSAFFDRHKEHRNRDEEWDTAYVMTAWVDTGVFNYRAITVDIDLDKEVTTSDGKSFETVRKKVSGWTQSV